MALTFTQKIIGDFLLTLAQNNFAEFNVLPVFRFSPENDILDFLRMDVANIDAAFKDATGTPNWVGLVWSRGPLVPDVQLGRRYENILETIDENAPPDTRKSFKMRRVSTNLSVSVVSPSLTAVENLEAKVLVDPPQGEATIDVGDGIGKIDYIVSNFELNDVTFQDEQDFGSIVVLELSVELTFPLFILQEEAKIIKQIDTSIFLESFTGGLAQGLIGSPSSDVPSSEEL